MAGPDPIRQQQVINERRERDARIRQEQLEKAAKTRYFTHPGQGQPPPMPRPGPPLPPPMSDWDFMLEAGQAGQVPYGYGQPSPFGQGAPQQQPPPQGFWGGIWEAMRQHMMQQRLMGRLGGQGWAGPLPPQQGMMPPQYPGEE